MTVRERMRTVAKTGRLTESTASHCMMKLYKYGNAEVEFKADGYQLSAISY
jgi:hypothetical protein